MKLNRLLRRDRAASEPTPEDPSLARGRREWNDRYAGLSRATPTAMCPDRALDRP